MYLIVTRSFPPELGGMQSLMWGLAKEMSKNFMIKVFADYYENHKDFDKEVNFSIERVGGIKILRGNIAPDGAIIKPSAATSKLMKHKGKSVVFESVEEFHEKIDDPNLEVDENSILVLKNCGPKGYPGMAEVGNMRLPQKLLKKGIKLSLIHI